MTQHDGKQLSEADVQRIAILRNTALSELAHVPIGVNVAAACQVVEVGVHDLILAYVDLTAKLTSAEARCKVLLADTVYYGIDYLPNEGLNVCRECDASWQGWQGELTDKHVTGCKVGLAQQALSQLQEAQP